eukprot:403356908
MSSSKTYESQVESQKYNIHQDSGSNKKEDTVDQENDLKPASEFVINAPNLLQFGNQENIADNQQLSSLQLISQRQLETTQPSLSTQPQRQKPVKQFCKLHFDRVIEYFCQQCNFSVCSRCMFLHHNGHDLKQLEDALKNMKFKLQQFDAIVNETLKENSDTKTVLIDCKASIEEMRQKQQEIIDIKFLELIRKIEERKTLISRDVLNRYDQSIFKLNDKIQMVEEQYDKLMQSQNYYSEVYNLLKDENFIKDEGSQIQIQMLEKVPDFDKFINESNLKIKTIQVALKSSFSYPKGSRSGTPSNQSTQNFQNIQIPPLPINMKMSVDNSRSRSLQNNQDQLKYQNQHPVAASNQLYQQPPIQLQIHDQQQYQLAIQTQQQQQLIFQQTEQLPLQQQQQQQQINMNSKFAKLKFTRQPTNSSRELTLQLETPHSQQIQNQQLITVIQEQHNNNNSNINMTSEQKLPAQNKSPQKRVLTEEQKESQEEQLSKKIKLADNAIYCIGDTRYILMFDYKNSLWQQIYFDKSESHYQGDLKFTSIVQTSIKKKEFIMTGGCHKLTKDATNVCYRFSIPQMRVFKQVQSMKQARYGHASVFINQLVLVMGGFNHKDDEAQAPSTLNACEKYSIKENEWTPIASMIQERAYFSAVRVKEEFIYVFGGFQNYETTNSIEYYNIMLDKWTILSLTMPIKLAKYGLAKIEENQIVIAGGLLVDNSSTRSSSNDTGGGASYSQVNTVYKFDVNTLKWTKLSKLNFRRSMFSTMPVKENMQIFAIGGTVEGTNEVYDIRKKKWNACQSYTSIMGQNDLQTYAICSLSKFGEE